MQNYTLLMPLIDVLKGRQKSIKVKEKVCHGMIIVINIGSVAKYHFANKFLHFIGLYQIYCCSNGRQKANKNMEASVLWQVILLIVRVS